LLDQEGFYLLDEKDKMVRIDTRLHKRLREFGMIESYHDILRRTNKD
jgi:hypothetical protein